jgi:predicted dehydrogenase
MRSDPQRHFLLPFIRSGALGRPLMARAQWHRKQSWSASSPVPERAKAINWRLDKNVSLGLAGEVGIHQIDQAGWFFNAQPMAATGFGGINFWRDDGRDVADTIQAIIEFPNGVNMMYNATLANSFDSEYEVLFGSDAAVMMRDNKAWMFKEVDSPLLGWEVYARGDSFYKETGIFLVAGSSKQDFMGFKPTDDIPGAVPPLQSALERFLRNAGQVNAAIEDFTSIFGADDAAGLAGHLAEVQLESTAGYLEGFRATVTAIGVNQAVTSKQRVVFKPEWYALG